MANPRAQGSTAETWGGTGSMPWEDASLVRAGRVVPTNGSTHRMAQLVRTIEAEIVPRLVLARRAAPTEPAQQALAAVAPTADEIIRLARLVMTEEVAVASAFIADIVARGASTETVYLGLLAPAARQLGVWWEADLCSFTDVTVGLCRLHQLLHDLSPTFVAEGDGAERGRRALLVPVPGEQHSFGLLMVSEFFQRSGWDVWTAASASATELARLVRTESFAIIGFSASCSSRIEDLAKAIRAIRRASRNRAIGVLVGGPLFIEQPELVARVGADATAVDGRQAALQAHNLLALLARPR